MNVSPLKPTGFQFSSRKLAIAALIIWSCSLPLTGLVIYSNRHVPGYEILLFGWWAILGSSLAWLANIFFLIGIGKLLTGKSAKIPSILAVLFSLDTFRFNGYLSSFGTGHTSPVYGYGWGAIIWFLSICLLMIAVGIREKEFESLRGYGDSYELFLLLGVLLTTVLFFMTGYFSIHDRKIANKYEKEKLAGIAYKRTTVCTKPEPKATEPIRNFSGTLKITINADSNDPRNSNIRSYPFRNVKEVLGWGIPIVRVGNNNFSFDSALDNGMLVSTMSSDQPGATLLIEDSDNHDIINAKLVEEKTKRVVFDQSWEKEKLPVNNYVYCPDYKWSPNTSNEQPRKLMLEALNLPQLKNQMEKSIDSNIEEVAGTIAKSKKIIITDSKYAQKAIVKSDFHHFHLTHPKRNNCPDEIGWKKSHHGLFDIGMPFRIKNRDYYPSNTGDNVFCTDDAVYFYIGTAHSKSTYKFHIKKRKLSTFNKLWEYFITLSGLSIKTGVDTLNIQSIKEENGKISLDVINDMTGETFLVEALLNGSSQATLPQ